MLTIIVTTLLISLAINVILKKLQLPTIIGYIATGTIVAYGFGLHDAVHNQELKEIAEFGVVFLMFTIGLEFSIEHLKKMRYEVFVTGSLQIILTALATYLIGHYILGITTTTAFIIALAVALSSTAIVLKTFNDTGEISRGHGQNALGILIMQDIAVIPILLIIGFMSSKSADLSVLLLEMFVGALILLSFMWLFGKYLLEPFFTQILRTRSDELFVGTILFLAIGASYLAHVLGFSYSLGAFIAGMLIAETKYKHQAEADLIPFRDLLLGIFFVTVGMQLNFDIIFSYLHIIGLLLIAVIILKLTIIYLIVSIKAHRRVAFKTALSLVQIGEFSLAILELARTNNLIGPPYGQVMIVTIVLSMLLTPFILKNLTPLADYFFKPKDEPEIPTDLTEQPLEDHTVIIGFGEFGRNIAAALQENGERYLAIENNIITFKFAQELSEPVIFGSALKKEVLRTARVDVAKNIIVAINNPKKLYHVCQNLQGLVNTSKIIVKVHNSSEKAFIDELGLTTIIVENELSSLAVSQLVTGEHDDVAYDL
ncbi:MAG: cation:proton antiporter [Sulfurimonadaceae bacterium]|nr:cation:proton antiporter [Sulfurimonadaceae bacterium]